MNCRVILSHPEVDKAKLSKWISQRFGKPGLTAAAWKNQTVYRDMEGLEEQFIWGDRFVDVVYGFLGQAPRHTLVWIEHHGGTLTNAFQEFKRVISSGASAILTATRPRFGTKVAAQAIYERDDRQPVDLSLELATWQSRAGQFSRRELVSLAIAFVAGLIGGYFWQGKTQSFADYLRSLDPFKDGSSLTLASALIWTVSLAVWRFWRGTVEVVFRA